MTRQQELGLREGQEPFEGDYRAKMCELKQKGLTPWGTEDVMAVRNETDSSSPLWNNYFDTDFGIAGTKEKIYLVPHSARLRAVTPETELTSGGLPLQGDALAGARAYQRNDLILDRDLTEEEAGNSPVWLDFADGDQELLYKYVEKAFRFGKDRFGCDEMMGIFVLNEKQPIERAVVLNRLDFRSRADGDNHLGNGTRFVGVRRRGSEATEAPAGRGAQTPASPYRKDPRSDLELFLSEHHLSEDELSKAVGLYKTIKELKL